MILHVLEKEHMEKKISEKNERIRKTGRGYKGRIIINKLKISYRIHI